MAHQKQSDSMKTIYMAISANGFLAISKFGIGLIFGSISIVADAVNNLSDFFTTIVMLIGMKASSKPADEEHPYGHERFELVGGLIISIVLGYAGLDVLSSSINKLRYPSLEVIQTPMWIVTGLSIVIKLMMMVGYKRTYRKTQSGLMEAGAVDSRGDVLIGIGLLIGFTVQTYFNIAIDGFLGLGIALLILLGAFDLLRETVTVLLGKRPSQKDIDAVVAILDKHHDILGYHDLLIHTYGNRNKFGSVHVELDGTLTLAKAHEFADGIEAEIFETLGFHIVVHLDPVILNDPNKNVLYHLIKDRVLALACIQSIHDLQINTTVIEFDVVLGKGVESTDEEILSEIHQCLNDLGYTIKVNIDRNYLLR